MPKRFISLILVFIIPFFVGACAASHNDNTGSYLGLKQTSLKHDGLTGLGVIPDSRLKAQASGLRRVLVSTETSLRAAASVQYILYGDIEGNDLKSSAHVLVSTLENKDLWMYTLQTFPKSYEVYLDNTMLDGTSWKEHLLIQNSQNDWISSLWEVRGKNLPERWIGKRWSKTLKNYQRIVIEYREPMPEDIFIIHGANHVQQSQLSLEPGSDSTKDFLRGFYERAGSAFTVISQGGEGFTGAETGDLFDGNPQVRMNFDQLVGGVKSSTGRDRLLFKPGD